MYEDLIKKLRTHNGWALNKTLDEAADAIEELTAQTRWIPVTERLPVNTKSVLIVHRGGVSTGWQTEDIGSVGQVQITGQYKPSPIGGHSQNHRRRNEHGRVYQRHGDAERLHQMSFLPV